jgi:hypothetical protein
MSYTERYPVTEEVKQAMRDLLPLAMAEARTKDPPGEGSMIILGTERIIGKGMYAGGWKLQCSFLTDERIEPAPFVVVHAYSDSQMAKASLSEIVSYTTEDKRALDVKRLERLKSQRDRLDEEIERLSK